MCNTSSSAHVSVSFQIWKVSSWKRALKVSLVYCGPREKRVSRSRISSILCGVLRGIQTSFNGWTKIFRLLWAWSCSSFFFYNFDSSRHYLSKVELRTECPIRRWHGLRRDILGCLHFCHCCCELKWLRCPESTRVTSEAHLIKWVEQVHFWEAWGQPCSLRTLHFCISKEHENGIEL